MTHTPEYIKIKITSPYGPSPGLRQSPQNKGIWGNCQFFLNESVEECDFWFIIDDVSISTIEPQSLICGFPPICVLMEYPSIRPDPNHKFLAQFDQVISFGRQLKHPNVRDAIALFGWFAGIEFTPEGGWREGYKIYDDFIDPLQKPQKSKLISVISSNKAFTEGHRKRLEFVNILQDHFQDKIDVYGRGIKDFADKWDVIAPYKYHIALENCNCINGTSEKLYDAFLGETFPIYYGCPNVLDYFPQDALAIIDITKPEQAIKIIEEVIAAETYEKSSAAIANAKDLVLHKYNSLPFLAEICETLYVQKSNHNKRKYTIYPEACFTSNWKARIKHNLKQAKNWFISSTKTNHKP